LFGNAERFEEAAAGAYKSLFVAMALKHVEEEKSPTIFLWSGNLRPILVLSARMLAPSPQNILMHFNGLSPCGRKRIRPRIECGRAQDMALLQA
jgi:hypothetical protein